MVQPSVTASGKVVQFFRAVGLFRPSYTSVKLLKLTTLVPVTNVVVK